MKKTTLFVAMFVLLISTVLAQADDADAYDFENSVNKADADVIKVTGKLATIISYVQYFAGGIAVLLAMITGVQFMNARDPHEKRQLGDKLKYIVIGLVIVLLSFPVVNLLL